MKVTRTSADAYVVDFESDEELQEEERVNLSMGGLRMPTPDPPPLHARVGITLRSASGNEASLRATVVAPLPDGAALAFEGDPRDAIQSLFARRREPESENGDTTQRQNIVDRLRGLNRNEKLLLAQRADRVERAFLVQDTDPQILGALLRNPRLTMEEVVRIAKSLHIVYQTVDVITKTTQWMANPDVRIALVHNPKTPPQIALRILNTLPESEIRTIARGEATSMQLKQAALRKLQGRL